MNEEGNFRKSKDINKIKIKDLQIVEIGCLEGWVNKRFIGGWDVACEIKKRRNSLHGFQNKGMVTVAFTDTVTGEGGAMGTGDA